MDGFQFGPIHIYWYSICLLAAVWASYAVAIRQKRSAKLSQTALTDLIVLALVIGVGGGRLGFVVQNLDYFSSHFWEIFLLSSGGLSIHGAILAGALAVWWYGRRHKVSFLELSDLLIVPLLVGQIIGRLGNYFNQELYGYPTQLPWKIFIAPENRVDPFFLQSHYHPTFLYEMILNGIGLLLLWRWQPKERGRLTGAYLMIYAIARFIVEIFRISDRPLWGLSTAQIVSILVLAIGYLLFLGPSHNILKKLNNSLTNLRENRDRGRDKEN